MASQSVVHTETQFAASDLQSRAKQVKSTLFSAERGNRRTRALGVGLSKYLYLRFEEKHFLKSLKLLIGELESGSTISTKALLDTPTVTTLQNSPTCYILVDPVHVFYEVDDGFCDTS